MEGFARLRAAGVRTALVSITWQFAVQWVALQLGVDDFVGTGWTDAGEVSDFWPEDKARWLSALLTHLGLGRSDLVAVGDSAGDLPMLRLAGSAYFVGAVPPLALRAEHWPHANIGSLVERLLDQGEPS